MFEENEQAAGGSDAGNEGEDVVIPDIDPSNATPEDITKLQTIAKSALAQKRHWREQAIDPVTGKKFKELVPAPVAPNAPSSGNDVPEVAERVGRLEASEEKRSFGYSHGLSPEETDSVFAYAKGNGLTPAKALESAFVKAGIDALRTEGRNANNTPGPTGRIPKVDGKTFNEMTPDERRKSFGTVVEATTKRR